MMIVPMCGTHLHPLPDVSCAYEMIISPSRQYQP